LIVSAARRAAASARANVGMLGEQSRQQLIRIGKSDALARLHVLDRTRGLSGTASDPAIDANDESVQSQ